MGRKRTVRPSECVQARGTHPSCIPSTYPRVYAAHGVREGRARLPMGYSLLRPSNTWSAPLGSTKKAPTARSSMASPVTSGTSAAELPTALFFSPRIRNEASGVASSAPDNGP